MSFKRNDIQEYIETKCGCTDILKWGSYKQSLCKLTLSSEDIANLQEKCITDAISYWLKALYSFTQALEGIKSGNSAWSIVKLYYSTFYSLRCELLINSHIFVRNNSLFCLNLNADTAFKTFTCGKARGDHQLTIAYYSKLVNEKMITDMVLSNNIDDESPYIWLLKQRERVNYQMQSFPDPHIDSLLNKIYDNIKNGKLDIIFNFFDTDKHSIYLFDKEYSMMSIPYYKLKIISHQFKSKHFCISSRNEEINHIKQILKTFHITDETIENITIL